MTVTADLHTHSTASDGQYTPSELVRLAKDHGLEVLALTDHDTIDGLAEAERAEASLGLRVLRGIELGAAEYSHLHILGYGFDPAGLAPLCRKLKAGRDERKLCVLEFLREKGYPLTLEDLETFRADPSGRLLEIGKKPRSREEIQGQFMGLLRFTPESWGWVKETIRQPLSKPLNKLDMTTLLQELLQRNHPIQTISTDNLWLECDSEQDILVYEKYFGAEL